MAVDFRKLVKAGVHFGHQTSRWSPKMAPYIWGHKNKIHLIDVSKTAHRMDEAAQFLESVAAQGKQILWIGTKKPAQKIIEQVAAELDMPFVSHRWIGGTLSNHAQVKKAVTKYLHLKDVIERADKFPHYIKKEINTFQKMVARLEKSIGGIVNLKWPIGAIVVVDAGKERSAVQEAAVMGIPVVGIVDTNCDPSEIDYVIPANDDAPSSISIIMDYLKEATQRGVKAAEKEQATKTKAKTNEQIEKTNQRKTETKTEKTVDPKAKKILTAKSATETKKTKTASEEKVTKVKRVAKSSAKTKTKKDK